MFTKNIFNTKKDPIAEAIANIAEADYKAKMEELKGQQHKLDKNKNNKLDSQDFKILRGEKKAVKEDSEQVEEGWDDMMKAAKERRGPQPSGGEGKKKGRAYGGAAQKSKPEQETQKEEVENIEEGLGHWVVKQMARLANKNDLQDHHINVAKKKVISDLGTGHPQADNILNKHKKMAKDAQYHKKSDAEARQHFADNMQTLDNDVKSARSVKEEVEQIEAEALIEDVEIINEVSLGAKIRAYAHHTANAFHSADYGDQESADRHDAKAEKIKANIVKHHGQAAADHAEKHAHAKIFGSEKPHGRGDPYAHDKLKGGLRSNTGVTKSGKIPKGTQKAMKNKIMTYGHHRDIAGPKAKLPEEVQIEERSLTSGEKAEMEKNVKGMKKNLAGFKSRYGDRAKSVMYATATKQAKKD